MVRSTLRRCVLFIAFSLGASHCAAALAGRQTAEDEQLESMEVRGTVGPYRIGLSYTVRDHTDLVTAHYFYASQLKNIPLTGTVEGESVTLCGADGSVFLLHFVGNGSNGNQPLTFYNSVGLRGFWSLGSRKFAVTLQFEHSLENPGERLYSQVTSQSDVAFEAMVKAAQDAILRGDWKTTSRYVDFPLRINGTHHHLTIRNEVELHAHWSQIFTPEFVAKLRLDVPHEMFVHNGEAMLGDGELWFDEKGLDAVNPVLGKTDFDEQH